MKIIVCADDYALSPGVSSGIRQALAARRVSATSVMPLRPFWPTEAEALKPFIDSADVGLHLTLTEQIPLGPMPRFAPGGRLPTLASLLEWTRSGTLPLDEIEHEIKRQFDAFEQALGRPPAHLDGHHYAHHLPGIRELVVRAIQARAPDAYVRSCFTDPSIVHRRGIGVEKAISLNERERGFADCLQAHGIPSNRNFAGLYDFNGQDRYGAIFPQFLEGICQGTLLVCHPGQIDDALLQRDSLTGRREEELAWLLGEDCSNMLVGRGIEISRFRDISRECH